MKHRIVVEFETDTPTEEQKARIRNLIADVDAQLESLADDGLDDVDYGNTIDYTNAEVSYTEVKGYIDPVIENRLTRDELGWPTGSINETGVEKTLLFLDEANMSPKSRIDIDAALYELTKDWYARNQPKVPIIKEFMEKQKDKQEPLKCDCGGETAKTTHSHWCETITGIRSKR